MPLVPVDVSHVISTDLTNINNNDTYLETLANSKEPALPVGVESRFLKFASGVKTWAQVSYTELTNVPSSFTPAAHNQAASTINSGTFADARIAQSNVTQHQAALSIAWSQLTSVPSSFTPSAHNHAAGDVNSGTFADARIAASNVNQHLPTRTGNALKYLRVNATEDGWELATVTGGSSQWTDTTGGIYYANKITVGGTGAPSYTVDISGTLRLQAASAPSGANGVLYFDTTAGVFKGYQQGAFRDLMPLAGHKSWLVSAPAAGVSTGTTRYVCPGDRTLNTTATSGTFTAPTALRITKIKLRTTTTQNASGDYAFTCYKNGNLESSGLAYTLVASTVAGVYDFTGNVVDLAAGDTFYVKIDTTATTTGATIGNLIFEMQELF